MKRKTRSIIISIIAIALLVIFDQITKSIVRNQLIDRNIDIWKDVLSLTFTKNTGAAWGLFKNHTEILSAFSFVLAVIMYILYLKMPDAKRIRPLKVILVIVIAGAIGNGIDRIAFKYVTDFIYFELINFPVFNVADCYITIGMFLLVFLIIFYYKDEDFEFLSRKKRNNNEATNNSSIEKDSNIEKDDDIEEDSNIDEI